jgi:hypothetical protein
MVRAVRSRICICCGEPMPEKGNSDNANLCSACCSIADDLEDQEAEVTPDRMAQLQPEAQEELRRAA